MLRSYNEAIILAYSMDRIYANYKRSVYAAISLANFGFFVRNDDNEIGPLLYFRYSRNLKYRFFPVFSLLQSLLKATKDVDSFFMMIIFPKLPSDSEHLLFSTVLLSLEFFILSKKCFRDYKIIQQLVFNALIITSQNQEYFYNKNKVEGDENNDVLNVDDFSDLATKLKKLTFPQFLRKKIVFDGCQNSLIDLIGGFGKIGLTVLTRMSIFSEFDESASMKEEILKKNRQRAKNLKMQIMNNFNKQQKSFQSAPKLGSEDDENDENDENQEESQKWNAVFVT